MAPILFEIWCEINLPVLRARLGNGITRALLKSLAYSELCVLVTQALDGYAFNHNRLTGRLESMSDKAWR
jgi:hypothetical protein